MTPLLVLMEELPEGAPVIVRHPHPARGVRRVRVDKWCHPHTTGKLWFSWIELRTLATGAPTSTGGIVLIEQEGVEWARGWDTSDAYALETLVGLSP